MVSFCALDFANEYHLLSNHKVFARAFQAKTFAPKKGGCFHQSSPGQEIKLFATERLLSSAKELIPGGLNQAIRLPP
jgi:hypothetical protein